MARIAHRSLLLVMIIALLLLLTLVHPLLTSSKACGRTSSLALKAYSFRNIFADFNRLKAEIDLEFAKMFKFGDQNQNVYDYETEMNNLIAERRKGNISEPPLTAEETAVLNDLAEMSGYADGEDFFKKNYGKIGNLFPDISIADAKIRFAQQMLRTPGITFLRKFGKGLWKGQSEDKRGAIRSQIDNFFEQLPPVNLVNGFPPNNEVDSRFEKWREACKDGLSGFDFTKIPSAVPCSNRFKSPFGPVSSSACYEEMGKVVSLEAIRKSNVFLNSKIILTVLKPAIVNTLSVSTLVKDQTGQHILLQIWNMSPKPKPALNDIEILPVGARFFLKNPFVKEGMDGWPVLRVDQPFDLIRLDIPPLHGSILVVGDGDFSFSHALARMNDQRGKAKITTTSLDSYSSVCEKYAKARENLDRLHKTSNVTVLHEIDATNLRETLRGDDNERKWTSIVWNCPSFCTNG